MLKQNQKKMTFQLCKTHVTVNSKKTSVENTQLSPKHPTGK